jgi:TPR repeat protein
MYTFLFIAHQYTANGGGVAVKGQDRAEEVLWSALGGQSLSTLLSSTEGECRGPHAVSDKCLRPPNGDPSSTSTGPQGVASSTHTSPMGQTDLEWHIWASAQDSDSHPLRSTDIDENRNTVDWVGNHREPSGSSGQKGRLTDGEFSHVSALLRNFCDVSTAHTVEVTGDEGSTVGVYGRAAEDPSDRSIQQRKTRDRDDYLTSSALYYPVARSMMAQQDFAVLNIYMQVLDELVFLWREEQGDLTILRNGGWVVGKNPSKIDDPEKQAEDGYYQEIVGENKEDRLKRKLSEATKGNVQSQSWMGMHFYSESNGNERVITEARVWFEKAAAQEDAVSNYFMGVLHVNRLGGLKRDFENESEYFLRAVGSFPMAWHALGDLHDSRYKANKRRGELRNEWYDDADLLIALEYYLTAAEYNVHESHFCLSNIYKTGSPSIPKNIPQALVHLTQAASLSNMKAVSHLAEAFYDEDSWLLEYLRTTAATKTHYQPITDPQNNPTITVESTNQDFVPLSYSSEGLSGLMERLIAKVAVHVKEKFWRLIHYLLLEGIEPEDAPYNPSKNTFVYSKRDAVTALAIRQKWVFNATVPLFVTLPGITNHILVPLPHPLWPTSDAEHYMLSDAPPLIPTLQPFKKRCLPDQTLNLDSCIPIGTAQDSNGVTPKEVASVLFKYVAEQSHALFVLNVSTKYLDTTRTVLIK